MSLLDRITVPKSETRQQIPKNIEVIPATERQRALTMWLGLEERLGNTGATNSAAWTEVWLNHFGNKVPHAFVFGKDGEEIIGATILTNPILRPRRGKLSVRSVLVGTVGEPKEESPDLTDLRLLVAPEHRDKFAEGIMQTIKALPWKWNQFLLQGFDPVDAAALKRAGGKVGIPVALRHVPFPVFNLEQARKEEHTNILSGLRTNKGRITKNRELLTNELGPLQGEWAQTAEEAQDIFTELVALNKDRWGKLKNEPGFFTSDDIVRYYRDLITALLPQGKASVFRLKAGDTTLGCILSFMDLDNVIIGYTSGINLTQTINRGGKEERLANYTPGLLVHTAYMQECLGRGYSQYDFGWGGEKYKVDLSNTEDELVFGFSYRGVKGHTVGLARNIFYHYRDNPTIEETALDMIDAYRQYKSNPADLKGAGLHLVRHATALGKELTTHTYTTSPHLQEAINHIKQTGETLKRRLRR